MGFVKSVVEEPQGGKMTKREKNLTNGIKETFRMNNATKEEISTVCKTILEELNGM